MIDCISKSSLRPFGLRVSKLNIQKVSRLHRRRKRSEGGRSSGMYSMPKTWRSEMFLLWCRVKCRGTLWSVLPSSIRRLCSPIRVLSAQVVLPTYWSPQGHSSAYTTWLCEHVMNCLMWFVLLQWSLNLVRPSVCYTLACFWNPIVRWDSVNNCW